jgi:AcrR family transcriptional regulator
MATSPTLRRTQYRKELRTLILDSAREIFVIEGFESFSMRKLADRVGYSPAALYQHFPSKEAIFDALVEQSFSALLAAQNRTAALTSEVGPVESLRRGLRGYVQFGLEHPNEYRLAFLMPPSDTRPQSAVTAFDSLRHRVLACLEAGALRPVNPELTAQALWAAVHGITSLLIVKPSFPWGETDSLIEQVIQSAIEGIVLPDK